MHYANVIMLYSAVCNKEPVRGTHVIRAHSGAAVLQIDEHDTFTRVSKLKAVKEILTFIFAIFIQMTTPAFGNYSLHIKFTKVSVNIKVQRICLPFRAHIF